MPNQRVLDMLQNSLLSPKRSAVIKKGLVWLLPMCLSLPLVSHAFAQNFAEVVPAQAQIMRFPGISIDGIHYDALRFAYAVEGELEVVEVESQNETLNCNGANKSSSYLKIHYRGPKIVFQIADTHSRKVLLRQEMKTDGATQFGRGQCSSVAEVTQKFEKQKLAWQTSAQRQVIAKSVQQMEQYMADDVALQLQSVDFKLFRLVNQSRFKRANDALDMALSGIAEYQQFGPTVDGQEALLKASQLWEAQLKDVIEAMNKQPELVEVRQALHRNLVAAYIVLGKFDWALRHDANAVHSGMTKDESLQETILQYERRQILSPSVAQNMVLTANLFRFGRNAVANSKLTEQASVADLDAIVKNH